MTKRRCSIRLFVAFSPRPVDSIGVGRAQHVRRIARLLRADGRFFHIHGR